MNQPKLLKHHEIFEAVAAAVPKGYALVPLEPTIEMAQALLDYPENDEELPWPKSISPNFALAAYRIMLAAAQETANRDP